MTRPNRPQTGPEVAEALRRVLSDVGIFSRYVIKKPLYEYQLHPIRAILRSVLHKRGREFLLIFPRQSGKNEAIAQLLVYLLNLFQRLGGNIVYGATGDGLGRGILRLEQRLENNLNQGQWLKATRPDRRILGRAAVVFLSTHPSAFARGETAHWLLVVDEMQDQDPAHLEGVFEPMRAANNATAVYIGTAKSTTDALWRKREELESLQERDRQARVFVVSPDQVTAENGRYAHFLENKVARLGRRHPIVASEYFNEPVGGAGRLFDERRLALMRGEHERARAGAGVYLKKETGRIGSVSDRLPVLVATLDVGGQDEAATDAVARLENPGRDYTVAHLFALSPGGRGDSGPTYRALDAFVDQGSRHFQNQPGRPRLADRLLAWLRASRCVHLVADASGVGAGLVDWLAANMGPERVTAFTFSPLAKASLGSALLSVIETGRFHYWAGEEEPLSDGWWFFTQAAHCTFSLAQNGRFERDLRWGVPEAARVSTPEGRLPVHDDRLVSAALVAVYDRLVREKRLQLGRAESAIVESQDPLDNLTW